MLRVGSVALALAGPAAGEGIVSWTLRDARTAELDGLATDLDDRPSEPAPAHPNGTRRIDHVVVVTPSLDRTAAALDDAGVRLRRERAAGTPEAPLRQGFFRLGEVILEVVAPAREGGSPMPGVEPLDGAAPARFWGLVFEVGDLDGCAELLGDRLGRAREAVQPGRRIATVRAAAGLGVPVAFITPPAP